MNYSHLLLTNSKKCFSNKKKLNCLNSSNLETFFISHTTPEEVSDITKTLYSSKRTGPDCVPTKITKDEILIPLFNLINKSFNIGIFPIICKLAGIVSVFKNEARQLCNNYRPISLLSNIDKTMEKLMYKQ